MKTSPLRLLAHVLCVCFAWLATAPPADAATDGINRLINVANLKAQAANEEALEAAQKRDQLLDKQKTIRNAQAELERSAPQQDDASPTSNAGLIVQDVAAIAEFESTASSDGLDDTESKRLGELVALAQQRVDSATADASTAIANAKKLLKEAPASGDKAQIKLHLKSLRATVKAHRQTAAALRAVKKKLAALPTRLTISEPTSTL